VTYNTNWSTLYHKDCSQSILHSPTVSLIQITRKARNSEYLLNVNNTEQKDINLTQFHSYYLICKLGLYSLSLLHQWYVTSWALKPAITFPTWEEVRHDSLQEIPLYRTSREITMFREAFQEFLSWIKNIQSQIPISFCSYRIFFYLQISMGQHTVCND